MASKVFVCKWATACCVCKVVIKVGEDAHFVIGHLPEKERRLAAKGITVGYKKDSVAHAGCWPPDEPVKGVDLGQDWTDWEAQVPELFDDQGGFVKRGGRNNERKCPSCFMIHAGECV